MRKTSAALDSSGRVPGCVYLVRVQLPSHHLASGEHVHPDVDVGVAALDPAVALHPLQALLRPVVVGEETITGVEKHPDRDVHSCLQCLLREYIK